MKLISPPSLPVRNKNIYCMSNCLSFFGLLGTRISNTIELSSGELEDTSMKFCEMINDGIPFFLHIPYNQACWGDFRIPKQPSVSLSVPI